MPMHTARRSGRGACVLLLLGLLVVPLVLAGHHHTTTQASPDCAACVVAQLSPAEIAPSATLPAIVPALPDPPAAHPVLVTCFDPPGHPGRAPPSPPARAAS